MTKEEHITYWLESADHDLKTAQSLFKAEKYDWCLFVGHLVLEKTLKALYIERHDDKRSPKTHNLVRSGELCQIEISEEQKFFLDQVTDFNIQTRYPDYQFDFYKTCTKEYTESNFNKIKDYSKWLKSLLK